MRKLGMNDSLGEGWSRMQKEKKDTIRRERYKKPRFVKFVLQRNRVCFSCTFGERMENIPMRSLEKSDTAF